MLTVLETNDTIHSYFYILVYSYVYALTVPTCRELQAAMVAGELPFSVAILNASLVPSLFALHVAAHKSLLADSRNALRTRSLYTEVIYNISGSKHVRHGCHHVLVG